MLVHIAHAHIDYVSQATHFPVRGDVAEPVDAGGLVCGIEAQYSHSRLNRSVQRF